MKKILIAVLIIATMFSVGCSSKNTSSSGNSQDSGTNSTLSENNTSTLKSEKSSQEQVSETEKTDITETSTSFTTAVESSAQEESSQESIDVDKGVLNVNITLPASYFKDKNVDQEIADAESRGIKTEKNADGSVLYSMSKSEYQEWLSEKKSVVSNVINDTISSGKYPSIKDIKYNDDFSEINVYIDQNAYSLIDGLAVLTVAAQAMAYQIFADTSAIKVTVNLKDTATGVIYGTAVYPDALQKSNAANS